jgi:hypothetical protein
MVYKQTWSIKNYRYVWDVSSSALTFLEDFLSVLTCGPQSISAKKSSVSATSALTSGSWCQIRCQLAPNQGFVRIAKNLQESGRFWFLKCKVVPFGTFDPKCGSFMLTTPW